MELKQKLGVIWSIVGCTCIIGSGIIRVLPKAIDAFQVNLNLLQWVVLILWILFMIAGEGYRGFQKQFSPRFAARMWHLTQHGRTPDLWLAPFFCIGYYGSSRRRIISSWSLTAGVTIIILIVIHIVQPWRGIIDCGVLAGLVYGLICTYTMVWKTLDRRDYLADPEIVESHL
jgi:hypothetical protein